jgi:hypothetical protein
VEEQPSRDPRLGRDLVERQLLDGAFDELLQPDPDELPASIVR